MKKMFSNIKYAILVPLLILGVFCMTACSSQDRSVALAGMALVSEIRSAQFTIESGEVIAALRSVQIPDNDVAILEGALADYLLARDNLTALKDKWPNVAAVLYGLGAEHERLRYAYDRVQYVVKTNWPLYEREVQVLLSRWRQEAYALEQSYQAFRDALDNPPEPLTTSDMLQAMLEIAYKMSLGE